MLQHLLFPFLVLVAYLSTVIARPGGGWIPPPITKQLQKVDNKKDLIPIEIVENTRALPDCVDPTDLLVVTTLDGSLHGVHRPTGNVLWSKKDDGWGPLVQVTDVSVQSSEDEMVFPVSPDDEEGVQSPQGLYIPEPTGNGDLYYYEPGKPIRKLPLPIKKIVDDNHAFMFGDYVFTGKKVNRLVAMDMYTGSVLRSFGGDDSEGGKENIWVPDETDVVHIGRTQYVLSMWDKRTSKLRWNITYGEFSAPHSPTFNLGQPSQAAEPGMLAPQAKANVQITSDADGYLTLSDRDSDMALRMQFSTPAVAAFHVTGTNQLTKAYPRPPPTNFLTARSTDAYVGHYNNTFYILSSKNFPDIALSPNSVLSSPSLPGPEDICMWNGQILPECLVGAHTVMEDKPMGRIWEIGEGLERIENASMAFLEEWWRRNWLWGLIGSVVLLIGGIHRWWKRALMGTEEEVNRPTATIVAVDGINVSEEKRDSKVSEPGNGIEKSADLQDEAISLTPTTESAPPQKEPRKRRKNKSSKSSAKESDARFSDVDSSSQPSPSISPALPLVQAQQTPTNPPKLHSLTVSNEILGYGSHGTVVYKGTFQNRHVAIKRLLLDFYDVADHEVKMLQESDDHPNVVRYFFREKCDGFMYIALELCPASLHDVIEKTNVAEYGPLRVALKPVQVLNQIIHGLHHLHSLKIVHRDIKPHNILVGNPKTKGGHPRILISDFGLGRRLADDQSSFHNTHHTAGGTVGWRAPECMLAQQAFGAMSTSDSSSSSSESQSLSTANATGTPSPNPIRITRAIDIFSAGCVFYYILTSGHHPFGAQFSREINILKGNFRLDKLDILSPTLAHESKDLIRRMISKDPKKRPNTSQILHHPVFWTPEKRLAFLGDASDRFEIEERDPPSSLLKVLERGAGKVIIGDWYRKIDRLLLDNLGKYRKYDGTSVRDLLRVVRNKKNHYQDLPPNLQKSLGPLPDGFLAYFTSRFPALLLHVYYVVAETKCRRERMFRGYFEESDGIG